MALRNTLSLAASSFIFGLSFVGCNAGPEAWEDGAPAEGAGVEQRELCSRPTDYPWEEPDFANVKQAITVARDQICKPYVQGSAGPDGFDSPGLVYYAYSQAGFNVPRVDTWAIDSWGRRVSPLEKRPGDLIIYRACAAGNISHVSLYVGRNKSTGAPQEIKAFYVQDGVGVYDGPSPCSIPSTAVRVQG
ncbi:C40 family peptidase [Cystobacter fuscus]|uniref:C40 family peptidase n=1 Tax=Cystobacter fuscus TaxID=43 RepID=UPI002B3127BA|nr:NlpC/P60 family protein [Cystobacter fuscus]